MNISGLGPVRPPAPTNNTSKYQPPRNVSTLPIPIVPAPPAKNDTKQVNPATPVQRPNNVTRGPTPQQPAKPSTNTTGPHANGSASAPPKPSAPATNTTTTSKTNTGNKTPANETINWAEVEQMAIQSGKDQWNSLFKKFDGNGDNKVTFDEFF